ncbi:hypothetical protein BsWGS_06113 [Bradybaena similaris]
MMQMMAENRRLRKQITSLQMSRSSDAGNTKNQNDLVTSDQSSRKRDVKDASINDRRCNSTLKTRIGLSTKTCRETEATSRELGDNSESSIAEALRLRQEQGLLECEFFVGGEADLHSLAEKCLKNPGHKQFIPIDKFSKKCLPPDYQDDDIVEVTRALAALTLRVRVKQGKATVKFGTGYILVVKLYPIWFNKKVCPYEKCKHSSTTESKFAEIIVYTAGHVVRDEVDGLNTTCQLFFDRESTPDNCNGVVSLVGAVRVVSESKGERSDRCEMTFVTHDLDLAYKLYNMVKHYKNLNAIVCNKYANRNTGKRQPQQELADNEHTLTIIVSHPHGCSKQVSVGNYTLREEVQEGRDVTVYSYTTATCNGSSGAPVFILNKPPWGMCEHAHHGISAVNPSLNCCCYGFF